MNVIDSILCVVNVFSFLTITQLFISILIIWLSYKTYLFWTCNGHIIDIDYRVFKDDLSQVDNHGNYTETFPNTWYAVIRSEEVLPGQVKPLYVLQRNVVVFRTTTGKIHVLDAFCPHLGANIGVGGSVVGEDIRCPFHSWTFNEDGICTSVPGIKGSEIPKAKLKRWDCVERNKLVYIWYHDNNAKPTWSPKDYQEFKSSKYVGHTTEYLCSNFLSWYINTFDKTHFNILHQFAGVIGGKLVLEKTRIYYFLSKIFRFEYEFKEEEINCQKISEPPYSRIVMHVILVLFGYHLRSLRLVLVASLYPPDFFFEIEIPRFGVKVYILISALLIEPRRWKLTYLFYTADTIGSMLFAKFSINSIYQFGDTDKIVLSNMRTPKKPCYTKLERSEAKVYRWLTDNFFSPNISETINCVSDDTL